MSTRTDKSTATMRKRMGERKRAFIEAYETSLALVSSTCRKAGITRQTFYNWYNDDEAFRACIDEINELVKDSVESEIYKKIKAGDTTTLIFYAKTKMKDRGYSERHEIVGAEGKDLIPNNEIDLEKLTPEQKEVLLSIGESVINDKGE